MIPEQDRLEDGSQRRRSGTAGGPRPAGSGRVAEHDERERCLLDDRRPRVAHHRASSSRSVQVRICSTITDGGAAVWRGASGTPTRRMMRAMYSRVARASASATRSSTASRTASIGTVPLSTSATTILAAWQPMSLSTRIAQYWASSSPAMRWKRAGRDSGAASVLRTFRATTCRARAGRAGTRCEGASPPRRSSRPRSVRSDRSSASPTARAAHWGALRGWENAATRTQRCRARPRMRASAR